MCTAALRVLALAFSARCPCRVADMRVGLFSSTECSSAPLLANAHPTIVVHGSRATAPLCPSGCPIADTKESHAVRLVVREVLDLCADSAPQDRTVEGRRATVEAIRYGPAGGASVLGPHRVGEGLDKLPSWRRPREPRRLRGVGIGGCSVGGSGCGSGLANWATRRMCASNRDTLAEAVVHGVQQKWQHASPRIAVQIEDECSLGTPRAGE